MKDMPKYVMPETIGELLKDVIFTGFLMDEINAVHRQRRSRPQPREGFHYKRDWYDRMTDDKELNSAFIIANIGLILIKKSPLSSEKRNIISYLYELALKKTFEYYNK